MKRFILPVILLAACQPADGDKDLPLEEVITETAVVIQDGIVGLRLSEPVSEPSACIIPIRIENGLDNPTNVTMIAFNLTGPGKDARGNMFAPIAEPGKISEARVIVEGQSCDAFDTISIPELRCTSGEENCQDKVELIDGKTLKFSHAG